MVKSDTEPDYPAEFAEHGEPSHRHFTCPCGSHHECVFTFRYGHGVYLFTACPVCFESKRSGYRADIFGAYAADEPIEEDY